MFDDCVDVWRLMHSFQAGTLTAHAFGHKHHLALALCYAALYPQGAEVDAFRHDLLRHVAPLRQAQKYHETITRFWLEVARHFLATEGRGRCMASIADDFVRRFADKTLIERHYDRDVLYSQAARERWVPPTLPIAM